MSVTCYDERHFVFFSPPGSQIKCWPWSVPPPTFLQERQPLVQNATNNPVPFFHSTEKTWSSLLATSAKKGSLSLKLLGLESVPGKTSPCQETGMVYFDDSILTRVSRHIRDWLGVSFLLREIVIGILWGEMFQKNQLVLPTASLIRSGSPLCIGAWMNYWCSCNLQVIIIVRQWKISPGHLA